MEEKDPKPESNPEKEKGNGEDKERALEISIILHSDGKLEVKNYPQDVFFLRGIFDEARDVAIRDLRVKIMQKRQDAIKIAHESDIKGLRGFVDKLRRH